MIGSTVPSPRPEAQHHRGGGDGEAGAPRLDEATNSYGGPWAAAIYTTAGEASLVLSVPPEEDRPYVGPGEGADPERAAQEACRRAATTLRRFCAHHGCDRLWSLTYRCRRCDLAPCVCPEGADRPTDADHDQVVADIERFRRRLNAYLGERVPLATVIEHHEDGFLHVHGAINRYVDKRVIEQLWGHGWVDLRRFRAETKGLGKRARCRIVAGYMSSYLKKDWTDGHLFGRHRYSTSRGMAPMPRRLRFHSAASARAWTMLVMGGYPDVVWASNSVEGWEGPPVELAYWNEDP